MCNINKILELKILQKSFLASQLEIYISFLLQELNILRQKRWYWTQGLNYVGEHSTT